MFAYDLISNLREYHCLISWIKSALKNKNKKILKLSLLLIMMMERDLPQYILLKRITQQIRTTIFKSFLIVKEISFIYKTMLKQFNQVDLYL